MEIVTIFTPTYNRKEKLDLLFNSLLSQKCYAFKWLIIDDGSIDNTKEKVDYFKREAFFDIEYFYQENAGKMAAFNRALAIADTDLFLCVDSDDYLVDDAIEKIINEYKCHMLEDIAGFIAYRGFDEKRTIGGKFPENVQKMTLSELYRTSFNGDTTLIFLTKVIKQFQFPEIVGEKFITERFLYNQIDERYSYILMPEVLTICEYNEDGYTINSNKLTKLYPLGWSLYYNQQCKKLVSIKKIKMYIKSLSYYFYASNRHRIDYPFLRNGYDFLCVPLGYITGLIRRIYYRIK